MSAPAQESNRFLVSIHHPAQAHFYRYIIETLRENGHEVRATVRDKEMTAELLAAFDIEHTVLSRSRNTIAGTALSQATYETGLLREARRFQPDVLTSIGGIEISHVAPLVGAKSLAFTDTPTTAGRLLTSPLLDVTSTPTAFKGKVRGEHRTYDGFHELAYLHPNRFEPRKELLREYGIDPDERIFLLRFVSWQAYHDVGESGFSRSAKRKLISTLDEEGTVYVTSEQPLPVDFEEYALPIPPVLIHDLLAVSDMYVGDSATMATEAAILGTPAIRSSSLVSDGDIGNFVELEESYELVYSFADEQRAIDKTGQLLATEDLAATWKTRRDRLLEDTIDVTAYAVEQLEAMARRRADQIPATDRQTLAKTQ